MRFVLWPFFKKINWGGAQSIHREGHVPPGAPLATPSIQIKDILVHKLGDTGPLSIRHEQFICILKNRINLQGVLVESLETLHVGSGHCRKQHRACFMVTVTSEQTARFVDTFVHQTRTVLFCVIVSTQMQSFD